MTVEPLHPEFAYYQNAWIALRIIRDAIEELGPVGALPSPEAVLHLYGPEPVHEAEALISGIQRIAGTSRHRELEGVDRQVQRRASLSEVVV